jgi:hypothetical protein
MSYHGISRHSKATISNPYTKKEDSGTAFLIRRKKQSLLPQQETIGHFDAEPF